MKRIYWLMLSGVLLASALLYVVMDHAACVDTEAVVLHNWHDHGWWQLHGGYAINAGGIQPGESVSILHGHLSIALWVHYFLYQLTGNLEAAYFWAYLVFVICLVAAFCWAFADKKKALLWAAAFSFSPAFLRSYLDVDPVSYGLLYSALLFPVALKLLWAEPLGRKRTGVALAILLLALSIDWPNALALAVWAPLFVLRSGAPVDWWRGFKLLLPLGLFSAALMVIMILHKQQGHVSLAFLANHYATGADVQAGHQGLAWAVVIKRHLVASGVGWLPLWCLWLVAVVREPRVLSGSRLLCLLPVVGSLLLLLVMKNYFADHQWLVAPLVANGLTASYWGWAHQRTPYQQSEGQSLARYWWWPVPFMFTLALFFALFFRMNNAEKTLTHELLARHTPRHAVILLYPYDYKKDSRPLEIAKRAELEFDRIMVPYAGGVFARLTSGGRPCFVLAREPLPGGVLVARAEHAQGWLDRVSGRALDFYRQKISQRRKGDSSDWAGWLYLYRDTNTEGRVQQEVQK